MTLAALHQRFAKDRTYRAAFEELRGWVPAGLVCRSARERAGISRAALAAALKISQHGLACFEAGDERRLEVVIPILKRWKQELRAEGIDVEAWFAALEKTIAEHDRCQREAQEQIPERLRGFMLRGITADRLGSGRPVEMPAWRIPDLIR